MRVLYVEDEPLARWTGKQVIESLGMDVTVAEDCAGARELWSRNVFDLVLSDYRLPDGNAFEFIEEMRTAGRREPVICLSGEAEDISGEQKESLALSAVIKKPLTASDLEAAVAGMTAEESADDREVAGDEPETVGESTAVDAGSAFESAPRFWVSPFWSINTLGRNAWKDIEVAAGRNRDLWLLLGNVSASGRKRVNIWTKLALVFTQTARWLPASGTPAEVLNRCQTTLIRDICPDFKTDLLVLCLRAGRVMFAGSCGGRWAVWYEKPGEGWKALQTTDDFTGEKETGSILLADSMFLSSSGEGNMDECNDIILRTIESGNSKLELFLLKPEDTCRNFRFMDGLAHIQNGFTIDERLKRVESALLGDGHNPFHVRRFGCALLGLMESYDGVVDIRWDADTLWAITGADTEVPAESELFFDTVERHAMFVKLGVEAFSDIPEIARNTIPSNALSSENADRAGLFHIIKMPPAITKSTVDDAGARCREIGWVALDMTCVRYASSQAMKGLYVMANERCGGGNANQKTGSGGFCLVGVSPLNESIFRYWGMDSHINMVSDFEGLDSMSGRLTSASERSALLRNINTGNPFSTVGRSETE